MINNNYDINIIMDMHNLSSFPSSIIGIIGIIPIKLLLLFKYSTTLYLIMIHSTYNNKIQNKPFLSKVIRF